MNKDFIIIVGHKTTKIIDIRKDNCVYEFDSVSKIIVDNLDKEEDEIVNIIIKEYPNISKINIINDYKDFIEELNQIGITKETSKKVIVKNNDANISYCVIEITNKCCFKCDHCYIPNNNNYIDFETYQKIIDELSSINCNEILITGGEPMLHPRFDEMYLYAKNKGFLVSINSNLFLLNKKTLSILTKFKPRILEVTNY